MTLKIKWLKLLKKSAELPGADEIHLWRVDLAELPNEIEQLSLAERARSRRFVFEEHRRRYIAAKSWTRRVLGAYLNLDPAKVPLSIAANGKPHIAVEANSADLHFNLSHCDNLTLLAVIVGREIGVDLQNISANSNWRGVAKRFFTSKESKYTNHLSSIIYPSAFAEIWTRKEAAGKALGTGLTAKVFSFAVGPGSWGTVNCGEGLQVHSLPTKNDIAAAVAVLDQKALSTSDRSEWHFYPRCPTRTFRQTGVDELTQRLQMRLETAGKK